MERGVYYDEPNKISLSGVYYDNTEIETEPGEQWLPIFDSVIPRIKPYYYISNHGRIYSTQVNNGQGGIKNTVTNYAGYERVSFIRYGATMKNMGVHRVEMLTFEPRVDSDNLQVNHINGDKLYNYYPENLEWCTDQENKIHAFSTGLMKPLLGENSGNATHTEEQIRKICEGLEKGLSIEDCTIYAGLENTTNNRKYVSRIKRKDVWQHVSDEYNIPEESYGMKPTFSNEEVLHIRSMMDSGLTDREIIDLLMPNLDKPILDKMRCVFYKIRHRLTYKDI